MRKSVLLAAALSMVTVGLGSRCLAAPGGFVLFGEPDKEAVEAAPETQVVHPVTSPYFFEDSMVTSDVRAWYLYHDLPDHGPLGEGHAQVAALQARLALTPQLQLVAYKDGYSWVDSQGLSDEGLNDIAAGLKWAFIQDYQHQLHAAIGVGYELPTGDDGVLQDYSEWRFWASVNKGFGALHLGATINFFLPDKHEENLGHSDSMSWHVHADYWTCKWFSPVLEFNGYHVLSNGHKVLPLSGLDVGNLGGSSSDSVVTVGFGGEVRPPIKNLGIRAAYETPLTKENQLFGYRITTSIVYSF